MLIQQFRYDNYRLHQLGNNSVFTITLQAGLSAIKTPYPLNSNIHHLLSFYVVCLIDHLLSLYFELYNKFYTLLFNRWMEKVIFFILL